MSAARPWRRAIVWLLFLGPFFFASYGFANWLAARRAHVGAVAFGWEHAIPFLPWTIIPYWSIDLLYALSLFVCTTRRELDRHAQRLLFVQLVSVAFFLAFPLRFSFDRPAADGVSGALFKLLGSFDKPFNQAPSLHIAILIVIWVRFAAHMRKRWLLHLWMIAIGISVLTTYQHHFIDLPTGMAVGFLALWAIDSLRWDIARTTTRKRLALIYATGAAACAALATLGGAWLWMSWPALALALVALNYAALGARGFQKGEDGQLSVAARALLAPYLLGAWCNSRLRTRTCPGAVHVVDDVWIGRIPSSRDVAASKFATIIDLCAEIPCGRGCAYRSFPVLDLTVPSPDELRAAAGAIESAREQGPVLVCCACGFSRSASAVITWLLTTRRAQSLEEATEIVRRARPMIVLRNEHRTALAAFA